MYLRLRTAVVLIASLAGATIAQAQTTWHVDIINCPGAGSGTEPDPFCKIQDGIDAAGSGDTVLVAPGTYNENIDFLGKDITLQSAEGPQVTIIEAILFGPTVRTANGESQVVTLEGFTVTHANNAIGPGVMLHGDVAAAVSNCIIRNNIAHNGAGMQISITSTASSIITDCVFLKNTGAYGAGVWSNSTTGTISITNTTFDSNTATIVGGAMHGATSWIVANCTFTHNSSSNGGAIWKTGTSTATFENCKFSRNQSSSGGGAVYNFDGSSTFDNCDFTGNITHGVTGGGAMEIASGTTVSISSTSFFYNFAGESGAAINISSSSNTTIQDSILCGNEPEDIRGKVYKDGGGNEFPEECPITGACCIGGACAVLTPIGCASAKGVYEGDDATCDDGTCSGECPADFNDDGDVDAKDLAQLLGNWGPCE